MNLAQEIRKFEAFSQKATDTFIIETVAPYVLKFTPTLLRKKMPLAFLALVHGNETVGLPILNELLQSLVSKTIEVDFEIYFALGNVEAALKNVRFLDEDLNRCFGSTKTQSIESARARELEASVLNHCDYVIDLHQTQNASRKPFFIFQYSSSRCLAILEKINPGIATILQTDPIGENTELSTDEYLRLRGGFGVALELGEKGDLQYTNLGLDVCKRALTELLPLSKLPSHPQKPLSFSLYQLAGKLKAMDSSDRLDGTLRNFEEIKKGMQLGISQSLPIQAPESGFLLFPRFENIQKGANLFHYCVPVSGPVFLQEPAAKRSDLSRSYANQT